MPSLKEQLASAETAIHLGWSFVGVYPQQDQRFGLHNRFISSGYEVADLEFDAGGTLVEVGKYALWAKPGTNPILANCGCVYHAMEGLLCEHDIALLLSESPRC